MILIVEIHKAKYVTVIASIVEVTSTSGSTLYPFLYKPQHGLDATHEQLCYGQPAAVMLCATCSSHGDQLRHVVIYFLHTILDYENFIFPRNIIRHEIFDNIHDARKRTSC